MNETLGMRTARYRKEKNLTQEKLAELLGLSSQAVSKWENDQSCPDILLLPELARILDVTVDRLLSGDRTPEVQLVPAEQRKDPRDMILHINVVSDDGDKVRVNLPMPLIKAALEIGLTLPQVSGAELKSIDLEKILQMVDMGLVGKLVEVESADGTTVEITVE